MKPIPSLSRGLSGALMACLTLALQPLATAAEGPDTANTALIGEKAIGHLKATGQYESLSAAITAARYAVRTRSPGDPEAAEVARPERPSRYPQLSALNSQTPESQSLLTSAATAGNPAHGIFSTFTPEGLQMRVRTGRTVDAPTFTSDWRLESLGYGAAQMPVPAGELKVEGQRAELARPAQHLTEWFHNTPDALEHGFILQERPTARTSNSQLPLRLVMAVTGDLTPHADAGGQRLDLRDAAGHTVLSYAKLKVWDATGAELPARMEAGDGRVILAVNDATARYPVTVDPTFFQEAILRASGPRANDDLGKSVAIGGDTIVVGAPGHSYSGVADPLNVPGAAYVFGRNAGGPNHWGEVRKLTASDAQADDHFGDSVAIDGNTIVVGAPIANGRPGDPVSAAGAAYVFARDTGGLDHWGEVKILTATVPHFGDEFGRSVAISGDTIVVGALFEDSVARSAGAAYVFSRNLGGANQWGEARKLTASDGAPDDIFGGSVGISGDTIVVGASDYYGSGDGAAYVFSRNAGGLDHWGEVKKLTSDPLEHGPFGDSVAIDGDTIVAGAPEQPVYPDPLYWAGAAYVFKRDNPSAGQWGQVRKLTASDAKSSALFGYSVAISGDRIVVGASGDTDDHTGSWVYSAGAAYVFARDQGGVDNWGQVRKLTTSDAQAGDGFGLSVGISGQTIVGGAEGEDGGTGNPRPDAGAAYVFDVNPSGTLGTSISPARPIRVGQEFVVKCFISDYISATEIDRVLFHLSYPSAMFSLVPASLQFNDEYGLDENWLRLAPQDGVILGAPLPLTTFSVPSSDGFDVSLADERPSSTRGTRAGAGFLVSFRLHANAAGVGAITPSAPFGGTVLTDVAHAAARAPEFSGATVSVIDANAGQIIGQVDMVGVPDEIETAVPFSATPSTRVVAQNGPHAAHTAFTLPPPYHGGFILDNLPPSSVVPTPKDYEVGAAMNIRTGRRLETFYSPVLGQGLNQYVDGHGDPHQGVPVTDAGTTDLGNTFVMQPGYVEGHLFLQGPTESLLGHASALRGIVRSVDIDADHNGIPDVNPDGDSRVSAAGWGFAKVSGATYSAAGAQAFASFEGEFNPTRFAFEGDYQLVLAGLNGEASYWSNLGMNLRLASGTSGTPDIYVDEKLLLTEVSNPHYNGLRPMEIQPGEHNPLDLNYCLSEVTLEFEVPEGTMYAPTDSEPGAAPSEIGPRVSVVNSGFGLRFVGEKDFQGNDRQYHVSLTNAYGIPKVPGISRQGRAVVLLPEGEYHLSVDVRVQHAPDPPSPQTFNYHLTVGCGERLRVTPDLQVQITSTSVCGPGGVARVEGEVLTPTGIPVSRIEWSIPGGVPQNICGVLEPCGLNPLFSFDLPSPSDPCAGTLVTVTAYTADGHSASATRNLRDTIPPVITVADKTVECGSGWDFGPVSATDACSGVVVPEVVGTVTTSTGPCSSTVERTWRATDTCGNAAEAKQTVTVMDTTPPTIIAANVVVDCPQRVNFFVAVEDNCGGPITGTVTPPIGSFFPPSSGEAVAYPVTTEVVATAVDACGLRTERRFTITVLGNCPMATSLGVPLKPLGNAIVEAWTDGSLRLSGLGGSVASGLRLDPGEVTGMRVDFDQTLAAAPQAAGSEFRVAALGANHAPLATVRMVRDRSSATFELVPDFSAMNSATFGIRFYRGSQLVHESRNRTAPPPGQFPRTVQIFTPVEPQAIRVSTQPGVGLVFEYLLGPAGSVQDFGGAGNINPDRLEVFPSAPGTAPLDSLSGLDLSFSGINERIISGMALTKFGQEIRASRGVAMAGVQGSLAVAYVHDPAQATSAPPNEPPVFNTANPLGFFDVRGPGNPSGYSGYWEGMNPLGDVGQWDLQLDLSDRASVPLSWAAYRPGKSSAELGLTFIPSAPPLPPPFPEGSTLRVEAGGVADASPGALTVEMGALVFEGKAGRVELGAEIPGTNSMPLWPGLRLEVTLTDGTLRTFQGAPEALRVSWDPSASMPTGMVFAIGPAGLLTIGIRTDRPGPQTIHLPDGADVQATALSWTSLEGGQTWTPGSLRGLLLVGDHAPALSITGLTTSTDNPTPATYFADHQVTALGDATFRTDAFGSLVLSGLTQSGEDGVAINYFPVTDAAIPTEPNLRLNLGYVPFFPGSFPPTGALLDLRVRSEGNPLPNAVLAGQSLSAGGPIFLRVGFPNLHATNHTLRVFRGDQVIFDQSGRPNEAPTERGNLAPNSIPDTVAAQVVNGRFTWVLTWNRTMVLWIYNQPAVNPFQGDRVEIAADDGTTYPDGENTLELRAGSIDGLRLLNPGNRGAPAVPTLSIGVLDGRLNLLWGEVVSGAPRLQVAPFVNGPWQNFGLGALLAGGQRGLGLIPTAPEGYLRLVTRTAPEGCLNFSAETPGARPNPWKTGGWKFERFGSDGSVSPANEVVSLTGDSALGFDGWMDIELPAPAAGVDVTFQRSGGDLTIIGYDQAGEALRKVINPRPTTGGAEAETLEAPANRPLRRLRLVGRNQPVNLRELCLRAFQFHDVAQSRSCLPLRTLALGTMPNPWTQGDLTLTARNARGDTPVAGTISRYSITDIVGYEVAYEVELNFAHACPQVEIEFVSGLGSVDFQPYDDLGTALPPYHLDRTIWSSGETAVFTADPRPISRVVVTSSAGNTRLMKICGGPVPEPLYREMGQITVRPTRNPQPAADMLWTFYDATHALASSTLRTIANVAGLEVTPETDIDFATDQLWVELRLVVDANGATISADATIAEGGPVGSVPSASYPGGVHTLRLANSCDTCSVAARIRRVRLGLTAGNAIVTRIGTPLPGE